jgi:hypothetical protein
VVERLQQLLTGSGEPPTRGELALLAEKLEKFWKKWRPSDGGYIPPRQTADTNSTVRQINALVRSLLSLDQASFKQLLEQSGTIVERENKASTQPIAQPCVFIGHGRTQLWVVYLRICSTDVDGLWCKIWFPSLACGA